MLKCKTNIEISASRDACDPYNLIPQVRDHTNQHIGSYSTQGTTLLELDATRSTHGHQQAPTGPRLKSSDDVRTPRASPRQRPATGSGTRATLPRTSSGRGTSKLRIPSTRVAVKPPSHLDERHHQHKWHRGPPYYSDFDKQDKAAATIPRRCTLSGYPSGAPILFCGSLV